MSVDTATNLDYLIDRLRLWLGDITVGHYRYTDAWLRTALVVGIEALMPWWNRKYLINQSTYYVERNTADWSYVYTSPPVVQPEDTWPIVIMASIITKEGSLENSSWNIGRWRDAEISYSNIAGGQLKDASLKRDWDLLMGYLTPPTKKLRTSKKGDLPGYRGSKHESGSDY